MPLTVGFDLDLTLIDTKPGMVALLDRLADLYGVPLDSEHFGANLGPPLEILLPRCGMPEDLVPRAVIEFRTSYPEVVIPSTVTMPGAAEAIAAVRAVGGKVFVITGKYQPNAVLHMEALGWEIDGLAGELWAVGKADALREHGVEVYVGDHVGDIEGALAAGATAVGVTTGPYDADELRDAGAQVVLSGLGEFPRWLARHAGSAGAPR
ncbi:phosphoglycolate phosphatase [Herbihabitans rhizosphaerae]|uniref:Phosphoglycolate phosphatase n=1 Tax=Herbihabitans rhizosphaerae TaxID=1872711 RepID=A0A4Q7KZ91_9PSEU|nr:HAD hydrolase-like protein [Herbihabitans rhizosphaerae]RZS41012.1 phosphoglycolate phosphatase [Herbihabitans rhizosphaerae]